MQEKDKLEQIENLAELQFRPEQIAVILEISEEEFAEEKSAAYRSYLRGQLHAEAEVRKSILKMARQGSTPAQKQMLDIIERNRTPPRLRPKELLEEEENPLGGMNLEL